MSSEMLLLLHLKKTKKGITNVNKIIFHCDLDILSYPLLICVLKFNKFYTMSLKSLTCKLISDRYIHLNNN